MVLEELILHYYLKVFSLIIVAILIIFLLFAFYVLNRDLNIPDRIIIKKGEKIENLLNQKINDLTKLESIIINTYFILLSFLFIAELSVTID